MDDEDIATFFKVVLMTVVIAVTLGFLGWAVGIISFPARQAEKLVEHTIDVDTAFTNYEYFHDTYNDILAAKEKIKVAYDMTQNTSLSEDLRYTNQINYTGLINFTQSMIGDYNSKSSQWNKTLFKDKKLPYKIKAIIEKGTCQIVEMEEGE